MNAPSKTDLESQIRHWIKTNKRESRRLEFKLKIDLSTPGAKAEFIRDVIALANSEGEDPPENGYLVIGFKDGRFYESKNEHYDGATFGQLLDSNISPPLKYAYEQFSFSAGRIGVLIIKPESSTLYVVKKKLQDSNGRVLLTPGQCLGRKSDRKIDLDGDEIHARLQDLLKRRIEKATQLLTKRIKKLEHETGPAFEVKRIRFEMERTSGWAALDGYLLKLIPYAREFDHSVKHQVLDAVMNVTGRTRQNMPLGVAQSVDTVLMEVMPIKSGGVHHPTREKFSDEDQELLKRIENAVFELTWDACRYLRNMNIVKVAARLYWVLVRFATLNQLYQLQAESLHNARHCRQICLEKRMGKAFPEGYRKLGTEIADALNAFDYDCKRYKVRTPTPKDVSVADLAACSTIIKKGEAVDWESARKELPLSSALAVVWKGEEIVGVGAIKRERRKYAAGIATNSGVEFPQETLELGYVAVSPKHRGHHLSHCIVKALLKQHRGRLFATTYNDYMKNTLTQAGFEKKGKEWKGNKYMLSFWDREI